MPAYRALSALAPPLLGLALLLAGCETEPTQPDPTEVRLNDMDQRLGRVERVVSNQSLLQLSAHVEQLDQQQRELRGQIEQLQNANDTLTKQQRDFYADLDRRIGALESAAGAVASTKGGGPGTALAGGVTNGPPGGGATAAAGAAGPRSEGQSSDQGAYARAFDTLKSGNYGSAVMQFQQFLQDYPSSDLDDNAQYWLGEAHYVMRDYDAAAAAFRAVGEKYPQSRKAPDALLKLAYTQLDQQQDDAGRATLQQVVRRFPTSDAAKLATQRLSQLPQGSP
jgi:tol-pal system protein YbgF